MNGADWEEVRKLASDFQRTQAMTSVQKLSERNCVDIVKRLIQMQLIDVIFTQDGKEYITSEHLTREIENELYAAGGRIAISDLVSILSVDYSHIEGKAAELVRHSDGDVNLVLEQLISKEYKDTLTSEIDLHLQEVGTIQVSELSKQHDLPADFLLTMLEERVGSLIKAKLDKSTRTLYTSDYLARYESRVQGIFSAVTLPVALQTLVNRYSIPEKILSQTLDHLIGSKRVLGSIAGSTFIPEVYSKSQQDYISNFFKHNRYLEYSTLSKLGVSNASSFLVKKFGSEIIPLDSCAVDRLLFFQIETTLEDCIQNGGFVDLFDIMPSVLSTTDIDLLIRKCLENNRQFQQETVILCDTIVVTKAFIEKIKGHFNEEMKKRSDEDLKSGAILAFFAKNKSKGVEESKAKQADDFEDDSRKKGKGRKSGGGGSGNAQGREIKTKAVKNKYKTGGKGKGDDDDDQKAGLRFLSMGKIIEIVTSSVGKEKEDVEINELFYEALAELIEEALQKKYEQVAQEAFLTHNAQASKTKMSFPEVQKFVNDTLSQIVMFTRSLDKFNDDMKGKLEKHLQKSLCNDIVSSLVVYFSPEDLNPTNMTPEARVKHINKLDNDIKDALNKVNAALNAPTVTDFVEHLEDNAPKLDLMIKRLEKKREKNVLAEHRQALIQQLSECKDPILGLHLAVLLAFQVVHESMLHASGKFVPQILHMIERDLTPELRDRFRAAQEGILKLVACKDHEAKAGLQSELEQQFADYQPLVVGFKKPSKE